jgi:hypothetical protein
MEQRGKILIAAGIEQEEGVPELYTIYVHSMNAL